MDTASRIGRWFFAIAIVAFGVLHLVFLDFVTRVIFWWPAWVPGRPLWAAAIGAALIAAGAALAAGIHTQRVAVVLGYGLLLSFVLLGLPPATTDSALGGMWTRAGKTLALSGGAFLAAQIAAGRPHGHLVALGSLGRGFFGAFLMLCGVQHFVHLAFVVTLVPSWVPGGASFWTVFSGIALIAAGLGVIVPWTAWLAGMLTSGMIFAWVLMLHIPRAIAAGTRGSNETTAVFEALAMSGIALLVAATTASVREQSTQRLRTTRHQPVTSM